MRSALLISTFGGVSNISFPPFKCSREKSHGGFLYVAERVPIRNIGNNLFGKTSCLFVLEYVFCRLVTMDA